MKPVKRAIKGITFLLLTAFASYSFDVSGTVYQSDSTTTIAGVELFAYPKGADDANVPPVCVAETKSDQNGAYSVTLDGSAEKYYILAECTETGTDLGKRIKKWITGPATDAHVYLKKADEGFTTITGTITNTAGNPVPGAKVVLRTKVSSGGTARFNVDSAVTGTDGTYEIPNAQVMVPENVGEKVASFHISATGYDNGVVDPLEMEETSMVVDFVLTGGTSISLSPEITTKVENMITINGNNIQVRNLEKPAIIEIFKANGTVIAKRKISPRKNSFVLNTIAKGQILLFRVVTQKSVTAYKAVAVF